MAVPRPARAGSGPAQDREGHRAGALRAGRVGLFLDTDEFVLPSTGSLSDLPELAENDILTIERFDVAVSRGRVHPVRGPDRPACIRRLLLYAGAAEPDPYPKVMARPEAIVRLHEGDHRADPDTLPSLAASDRR